MQGAIIAQVATTALVLPNLDKTHWIARALFVTSLSSGCFSVYYACRTQKTVGTLYHPNDLKDWLSRKPSLPLSKNAIRLRMYELNLFEKDLRRFSVAQEVWNDDFETVFLGFQNKFIEWENSRRSASISAAFMVRAPCLYLQLALGSFVSGFAVYLWSNWRRNIDRVDNAGQTDAWNKNEARNIFILFMLIFGPLFVYERCAFSKDLDLQPLRAWRDYERKLNKCALLVQEYRSRSNGSATVLRDGDFAAPVADANDVEMGAAAIELPDLAPSTANTFIPNDRSNAHGISILPDGPLDSTIPSPPTDGGLQAIMLKLASALEEYKSAQLASTSALKASTEAQMASTRKLENLDSILSNLASIPR